MRNLVSSEKLIFIYKYKDIQQLNLKMNTVHVISYFDIVLVFVLFMEYVLFRVGHAKQLFDKYRAEDVLRQENTDKQDHMLESILYQMDDFSLRIQKIDENMRKYIDDEIDACNYRIYSATEKSAFTVSCADWKDMQHKVRELSSDMSSLWRIIEIPQHMMHLRPHYR
jgi:hypothetical protein